MPTCMVHTLEGRLTDRDGGGQRHKVVVLARDDETIDHTMTGEEGWFSLNVEGVSLDDSNPDDQLIVRDPARGGEVMETVRLSETQLRHQGDTVRTEITGNAYEDVSHGQIEHRGLSRDAIDGDKAEVGRFVRTFRALEPYRRDDEFLIALGEENGPLWEPESDEPSGDADLPAGYAFFAQFIDHEITLDLTSSLERRVDPQGQKNFRTPRLDLDSMYGDGPEGSPFLYDQRHDGKLLLGETVPPGSDRQGSAKNVGRDDVQRNRQDTAIIVDPRNDENLILSQMLTTFIKFHNHVIDWLESGDGADLTLLEDKNGEQTESQHEDGDRATNEESGLPEDRLFELAQTLVRYHYQWVVETDFLPRVCDRSVLDDIERRGRQHFLLEDPAAIPIEFSVVAYRYGHSQIRNAYVVNESSGELRLFPDDGMGENNLRGFRVVPADLTVDWSYFFDYGSVDTQPSRKIDPFISDSLFTLPFREEVQSLATRNLLRGDKLGLPSGQALARAMDIDSLENDELPTRDGTFDEVLQKHGRATDTEAPPWYYILAEAAVQADGEQLGAMGSRIVAETLIGLLELDETSLRSTAAEEFEEFPVLPAPAPTDGYTLADIMQWASQPAPNGLSIADVDAEGDEVVELMHDGEATLTMEGYAVEFGDGETADLPRRELDPGESLTLRVGDGPTTESEIHLGLNGPVIDNDGDTVSVLNGSGVVSAQYQV